MIRLLAASLVGLFGVTVAGLIVRPDQALSVRLRPYLLASRSRFGQDVDLDEAMAASRYANGSLLALLFNPIGRVAVVVLEGLVDVVADDDELSLRMRQAGQADSAPGRYRRAQARFAGTGLVVGGAILSLLGDGGGFATVTRGVVGAVGGFWLGGVLYRAYLRSQARDRADRLKIEAYSIALLLSVVTRAGAGPVSAIRKVAARTDGEITKDLNRCLLWLARGASAREAFDRVAQESPDPTVSRIFRLLSSSMDSGLNPANGLRDLAVELRGVRQAELDQRATKRRSLMLVPILVLMMPVVVLYAVAPASSLFFGL